MRSGWLTAREGKDSAGRRHCTNKLEAERLGCPRDGGHVQRGQDVVQARCKVRVLPKEQSGTDTAPQRVCEGLGRWPLHRVRSPRAVCTYRCMAPRPRSSWTAPLRKAVMMAAPCATSCSDTYTTVARPVPRTLEMRHTLSLVLVSSPWRRANAAGTGIAAAGTAGGAAQDRWQRPGQAPAVM